MHRITVIIGPLPATTPKAFTAAVRRIERYATHEFGGIVIGRSPNRTMRLYVTCDDAYDRDAVCMIAEGFELYVQMVLGCRESKIILTSPLASVSM